MKNILAVAFFMTVFFFGHPHGWAEKRPTQEIGEAYAVPTFRELVQTTVMLGGYDIGDSKVTDEYAKIQYCNLYTDNYANDFQWNNIRRQIISRVQEKKEYYRVQYEIHSSFKLGRYNFDNQFFPLADEDKLLSVGSMVIHDKPDMKPFCHDTSASSIFPYRVILKLGDPLTFDKIKLPMDEAEHLLKTFETRRDPSRTLYARLRFKILDVVPEKAMTRAAAYRETVFLAKLSEIAIFLDKDMTQLVQAITAQ